MLCNADDFREAGLTVNVGFSTAELVTDSTTLSALLAAFAAAEETEEAASSASSARSARAMATEQPSARRVVKRMPGNCHRRQGNKKPGRGWSIEPEGELREIV